MTCSVCTQTSPSGCHSGSWAQPTSAFSSGNSSIDHPESSASAKPMDGRWPRAATSRSRPRCVRPAGRRAGSTGTAPSSSSSSVSSNRAANCIARSTRRLSSPNVADRPRGAAVCRDRARPSNGSMYSLGQRIPRDGVDGEVAPPRGFLDRHRRVAFDENPCGRGRSSIRGAAARRRCRRSCRRGNSGRPARLCRMARGLPGGRRRECRTPRCRGLPRVRRSSASADSSNRSRTQPPTTSARPPRACTARAIVRRRKKGRDPFSSISR